MGIGLVRAHGDEVNTTHLPEEKEQDEAASRLGGGGKENPPKGTGKWGKYTVCREMLLVKWDGLAQKLSRLLLDIVMRTRKANATLMQQNVTLPLR